MIISSAERIDLERAKKLITIDNEILFGHIDVNPKLGNIKKESDQKYCLQLKRLCQKHLKNSTNQINIKYNYSSDMIDNGRLFAKDFSMQRMNNKVRGYLCSKYYHDIDMVNAQPTCLYYILKTYYPERKWTYLDIYIKRRNDVLAKIDPDRNTAKIMVIKAMNSENSVSSNSDPFLKKLDGDFKRAQKLIWDKDCEFTSDLVKYKALAKKNKMGKYLSCVLCCFENMVLQKAISKFDDKYISTLIMDGFHISKDIEMSINDVIDICNHSSKEYGITWAHKQFNNELDFLDEIELDEENDQSYDSVKIKFEATHFMIKSPIVFGEESTYMGNATYRIYSKTDFYTLCQEWSYIDIDAKGKEVEKEFFSQWLKDSTKRSYKQLDFVPNHKDNNEFYNTFRGFDCEINPNDCEMDENAIELFKAHLDRLTNHCEKSTEYLLSYIADIIQNPETPPGIALLFKSEQGFGKDFVLDFLSKMLNKSYICRTQDVKHVLGDFNTLIKDKIICQLNELSGKDGWDFKEKLKGLITAADININEKSIKQYTQRNSLRVFLISNRNSPIEISPDDRRFVVFRSDPEKPSVEYFNKLGDILNNNDSISSIYKYLKNYNITINLRSDRPITAAYSQMRNNNIDPLYRFINEIFVNNNLDEYFCKKEHEYIIHKKTNSIIIPNQILFETYSTYLIENQYSHIIPTHKRIKQLLDEVNVDCKKYNINGSVKRYYNFNKEKVEIALKNMKIVDDVEIILEEDCL